MVSLDSTFEPQLCANIPGHGECETFSVHCTL